ncbi:MAG: beta-ketoacyl-[acyl-carrier-protein] synthase II [Deltaproteobacteria bacterium]|nr:MAG: beta-ketoacyl-[acyl-carrier-protein] synthase II [Deltaproteobacteria bacterium]
MNRRVVITGVGLITPLGIGTDESWSAVCNGKSGIGPITKFDSSDFITRIAGEVKNFDPADFLPKKEANRTEPHISYSVAATRMAMEDASLKIDSSNAERIGVLIGCAMGGLASLERNIELIQKKGPRRVSPFFIPMMITNMAAGQISIHVGAKGPNSSVATACAAGTHAIGEAYNFIQKGYADAMIAGGVESVITPTSIAGFNALKALSLRNDEPQKASRPFDRDRDGFVLGEGCGIVILESLDHAMKRGAPIYAEIGGFGMSGDAYHITAPVPNGDGAARCMQAALDDGNLQPESIGYINAHGTGTPMNDVCETLAIKTVFQNQAASIPVSSTKSMTGHLIGGAGGVETVFTALTIKHGIIPPTINLDNPAEGCDLDYVPNVARKKDVTCAMTNSFGFGGTNASLILKKFLS